MAMGIEQIGSAAGVGPAGMGAPRSVGPTFDAALRSATGRSNPGERELAERFVAMALVEPVLAQLRETTQAAEPFGPSKHEAHFASMLDAAVAGEIVKASGWGLVDRIESTLASRGRAVREGLDHG